MGGMHAEGTTVLSQKALHATEISFSHPTEKTQMNLVAPLYKVLLCPHAMMAPRRRLQVLPNVQVGPKTYAPHPVLHVESFAPRAALARLTAVDPDITLSTTC
jgi:hypothetical protein